MKAALLLGPERIAIDDIPEPPLAESDVMIQPAYAGICGTDISFYLGHRTVPYPFVLGHEVTGSIVAVGAGVSKFSEGQRVIVEPNYPCGSCQLCLKGRGAVCAKKDSMGVNLPGCFAERVTAPAEYVWALPETETVIENRQEGQPNLVRFSNWQRIEDRDTGNPVIYMTAAAADACLPSTEGVILPHSYRYEIRLPE